MRLGFCISIFKNFTFIFILCFGLLSVGGALILNSNLTQELILKRIDPFVDSPLEFRVKLNHLKNISGDKIIVLGSSLARESIDEEQVNQSLVGAGLTLVNLGFFHASPVEVALELDEILKSNPKAIFFPIGAADLYREYDFNLLPFFFNLSASTFFSTEDVFDHFKVFFYSTLSWISPLLRYRDSFKFLLLREAAGENSVRKFRFDWMVEKFPNLNENVYGIFSTQNNRIHELALRNLLSRLSEKKIPVFFIEMPSHPALMRDLEAAHRNVDVSVNELFHQSIGARVREMKLGFIDSSQLSFLKEKDFADYVHLNRWGREKFSEFIGLRIRGLGLSSN